MYKVHVLRRKMSRLPEDNSEILFQLRNGAFSVQIRDNNPFGRIPVDQTIEEIKTKTHKLQEGQEVSVSSQLL